MYKLTTLLLLLTLTINAQSKKNTTKVKKDEPTADSTAAVVTPVDTTDPVEEKLKAERRFGVYTRKARKPENRMKLCVNLVSPNAMLNLSFNDSICKYPEVSKILFEKTEGDSTYMLIYIDAVTKVADKPSCDAGHETKLMFVRWNTVTNKAVYKLRNVSSCIKSITNMTKEPIASWDGSSPLVINYHKGGTVFVELRFDPAKYLLGMQSAND